MSGSAGCGHPASAVRWSRGAGRVSARPEIGSIQRKSPGCFLKLCSGLLATAGYQETVADRRNGLTGVIVPGSRWGAVFQVPDGARWWVSSRPSVEKSPKWGKNSARGPIRGGRSRRALAFFVYPLGGRHGGLHFAYKPSTADGSILARFTPNVLAYNRKKATLNQLLISGSKVRVLVRPPNFVV
jgi:hypothetical protein